MGGIAAISDDLSSDFREAAELAATAGLAGLAVRHVGGRYVGELDESTLTQIRSDADEAGIAITAVSSSLGREATLRDADDPASERSLERVIRAAQILDTQLVRVFATWIGGHDDVSRWADRPDTPVPTPVVDRLARLAERAEDAGVTLMLELEGASYVGTLAEAGEVLGRVGSSHLSLCWDVCNGWWSGEDPLTGWSVAQHLPTVDVQTKDVAADPAHPSRAGLQQVVLGTGDIPYRELIRRLVDNGYEGWFTVERVFHPRKPEREPELRAAILADIAALSELVGSVAYSAGGRA